MENEFDATESSGAKQMRETIERKDKEVKELEAKLASYQEKELNQVFEEVGLDVQKGFGKALKQVYDGPIEKESIAKFAKDEYGFEPATGSKPFEEKRAGWNSSSLISSL